MIRSGRVPAVALAIAAGLVLADASVVTLGLPELLAELHTTIVGVAAVIGVYTAVLALTLLPASRVVRRLGARRTGTGGLVVVAASSLLCARADDLALLLAGRAIQAVGGAAALMAIFALLHVEAQPRRRLWLVAAVLGTAVGPAVGGALTQAFDWRAIFIAQIPIALAGALACLLEREPAPEAPPSTAQPLRLGPAVALGSVSAALTGVLLLLVLLLVAGWNLDPLAAAGIVTVLPIGAVAGSRITGSSAATRAAAGCLLVAGGVLALAWLPGASAWWTIAPQLLAGVGMGMSLPALGGELLPERTGHEAALLLTIRHAGIVLALVLIAPIAAHRLTTSTEQAKLQGVALVLDAKLPPLDKLRVAPKLLSAVQSQEPRRTLSDGFARERASFDGDDRRTFDSLGGRADDLLVEAIGNAFLPAFLIAGALALLGAAALAGSVRFGAGLAAALALTVATPLAYAAIRGSTGPAPLRIADPCKPRPSPSSGGLDGFLQDQALKALDSVACKNGSSREALVLALASPKEARKYERRYGFNPRSAGGIFEQAKRLLGLD
ncbi:MAG TPA: MFS transporter [Solirubrobacteraceae bacterium]|nr:MFS transporter [Solirubrobacteraceae bacterium]